MNLPGNLKLVEVGPRAGDGRRQAQTGVDLEKPIAAGEYICGVLGRPTHSRAARAIKAKAA